MTATPMLEKHPSIGILASGVGAATSFSTVLDGVSSIIGVLAGLIGAGVGWYTLRIQRKKYLDSLITSGRVEKRVLLVEDEDVTAKSVGKLLHDAGFGVSRVSNGMDAVVESGNGYCCILLDLVLPDMHGLKVMQSIRVSHPELPIVVLSGEGDVKNAVRALRGGAVDYLTKPVDARSMIELVNALYNLGGARNSYLRLREAILRMEKK